MQEKKWGGKKRGEDGGRKKATKKEKRNGDGGRVLRNTDKAGRVNGKTKKDWMGAGRRRGVR